jgi:outer membrane protein
MKKLLVLLSFIPATGLATSPAQEIGTTYSKPERPLWEVGVGGIAAFGANYPGADESSLNGLAIPYVIYRGDFLRIGDGGGIRGVFVDDKKWEFDLSADASFDAESDDNKARQGMPDLDFLGEVGPQLKYKLISNPLQSLEVRLPVRAVFSVGVDDGMEIQGQGYTFAPRLAVRQSGIHTGFLPKPITVFASAGPTFATAALQEYFYDVKPQFARAGRPAYRAEGGYLGSEFTLGASTELTPRLRTFVGGNVGYYGGATNADSPLLKREVNAGVAVGFAYSFYQSEEKAASR